MCALRVRARNFPSTFARSSHFSFWLSYAKHHILQFCKLHLLYKTISKIKMHFFAIFFPLWGHISAYTYRGASLSAPSFQRHFYGASHSNIIFSRCKWHIVCTTPLFSNAKSFFSSETVLLYSITKTIFQKKYSILFKE